MVSAFKNELMLAGISTGSNTDIGKWTKVKIGDQNFDYYAITNEKRRTKKPLVPRRIKLCHYFRKHIKRILQRKDYDLIVTQCPEVLFFVPDKELKKTCFISPGLGNPLDISRYKWARPFGRIFDYFLVRKAKDVGYFLAAGDLNARKDFERRAKGKILATSIIQFPTRYNDLFYKVMDKNSCRKKINISAEEKLFVTVGRLNWFKGWKLMIDAFSIVTKKVPSRLVFIGDGEDEMKIKDYVKTLGLEHCVDLVGRKEPQDVGIYLNAADAFIMGSFAEGWSTTLVEACACCVPCVVTDFSSAREMVKDGENGYVVEGREAEVFASKMIDALSFDRETVIDYNHRLPKLGREQFKGRFPAYNKLEYR